MSAQTVEVVTIAEPPPTRDSALGRIIGRLTDGNRTSPGELAALRRLAPDKPSPAFWRILAQEVAPALYQGRQAEDLWATLLAAFAMLAPMGRGQGRSLGRALAETGYSESRLTRLLRADVTDLHKELGTAARWLVAHGDSANWYELADFAFSRPAGAGSDHLTARRIARDYFTALARKETQTQ